MSYFVKAGPLDDVEIMKTPEGKSRNFAFITFTDEESVPYAHTLLDGILLFGRALSVRFRDGSVHKARELEENERRSQQAAVDARAQQAAVLQRMQQHASAPLTISSTPLQQFVQASRFQPLSGQLAFSAQPFQFQRPSSNPYSALTGVSLQQQQVQSSFQSASAYQTPFALPHARQNTFPTYPIPTRIGSGSGGGGPSHPSCPYTSQHSEPHGAPTHRDERSSSGSGR